MKPEDFPLAEDESGWGFSIPRTRDDSINEVKNQSILTMESNVALYHPEPEAISNLLFNYAIFEGSSAPSHHQLYSLYSPVTTSAATNVAEYTTPYKEIDQDGVSSLFECQR